MSALLEQTVEEVSFLKGATILDVQEDDELGETCLALLVRTKDEVTDGAGASGRFVRVQVWQDVEGNGPGYLALVEITKEKP